MRTESENGVGDRSQTQRASSLNSARHVVRVPVCHASFEAKRERRRKHLASLFVWPTMSQAWKENFYEF